MKPYRVALQHHGATKKHRASAGEEKMILMSKMLGRSFGVQSLRWCGLTSRLDVC